MVTQAPTGHLFDPWAVKKLNTMKSLKVRVLAGFYLFNELSQNLTK